MSSPRSHERLRGTAFVVLSVMMLVVTNLFMGSTVLPLYAAARLARLALGTARDPVPLPAKLVLQLANRLSNLNLVVKFHLYAWLQVHLLGLEVQIGRAHV